MTDRPVLKLRRSLCPSCHCYFRNDAYGLHRVLINQGFPPTYHCKSAAEMKQIGWRLDTAGFWVVPNESEA